MFEKFTDGARHVMSIAQEEAHKLGQVYVGTEHILLGLIREQDGVAAKALAKLDVGYDELLEQIKQVAEQPADPTPAGHIPFTPRAKRVLEGALREMYSLGQSYIATEHLLLGIVREGNGVAMEALARMGVSGDAVRGAITELAPKRPPQIPAGVAMIGGGPAGGFGVSEAAEGSALGEYGRDITQLASEGKLDPVVGRENETERVIEILARRTKNNPLLIGDPGVGKTAVVEGLAQRIAAGDVPPMLAGRHVWTLDVASLVAGSKYRGEFEERLKNVVAEVIEDESIILFVDEMHTLIGAGSAEGSLDAAAIMKPALSRGEMQVIGATTTDEYRKHIEKDSAFSRRFQTVTIDEPTPEQTIAILDGLRPAYEEHHRVHFPSETIEAAVSLSDRYIQDRFLPDKAIDVLDEAAARTRVHSQSSERPAELEEAAKKLSDLRAKLEEAVAAQRYEDAAGLRDEEKELSGKVSELETAWRENGGSYETVTPADIAAVVSRATGVPVTDLTEAETSKLMRMEEVLHKRIVGQEEAVAKVSKAIRRSRAGLRDPRRPAGSFIFLGPSGTGKTELSKALAEFLFGTQDALITFDMSEYMEKHSVSKLVGAPPGYVGYDEGGELTKAVRQKPYSVILFDEIEKAHPDVFNILLQVLEEGRLTDGQGRKVDFKNTVVIMTSNVGAREIARTAPLGFSPARAGGGLDDRAIQQNVMGEVKKLFKPEFLNRVDDIVVFKSLTDEQLLSIVDLLIEDLRDRLVERGMTIVLTDAARALVAHEGSDAAYGARPLRRAIQTLIEDPLSEKVLAGEFRAGSVITADASEGKMVFSSEDGDIPPVRRRETMLEDRKVRPSRPRPTTAGQLPTFAGDGASD